MIVQGSVYLSAQRIDFLVSLCLFTRARSHLWYFYLSDELKKIVELIYMDKGTQWGSRKMFHAVQNSNQNLYFQKYSSHYEKLPTENKFVDYFVKSFKACLNFLRNRERIIFFSLNR